MRASFIGGGSMVRRVVMSGVAAMLALLFVSFPALAQITTGTVSGTVKDPQGGVIPGATVVLISETRGTKSAPVVTNETGTYVFPNVTADTYTVEITPGGRKTVRHGGMAVSRGTPTRAEPLTGAPRRVTRSNVARRV